ncbi:MAG TPA: bacillithiol biosynthesis deacetylase BshB1 [Phaeodactylibacter sp.]|nr:bacillithiol biosynthesis deacetylase BshB1 [Phaeodactylibacter sp.]
MQKVSILAIGVHPDDVELSCSGTLLAHIAKGYTAGLLDLTRGELGTRGTAKIREAEGKAAAEALGVSFRHTLDLGDGIFENNHASRLEIIRVLRACRPEVVLCNAPRDRHPDHGRAGQLAVEACFYSGLRKIETIGYTGRLQEAWRPRAVYHYIQDYNLQPDFLVDISDFMDRKMEIIKLFASQFYRPDAEGEPETPISSEDFLDFVRAKAAVYGRPAGYRFAEGFITTRPPGVGDLVGLV